MLALTKNGEIIHIKDALIKTDYYCHNCGGVLRVRNGRVRVKHFYHLKEDCGSKGESLIHKYWKNYFLNLKEFKGSNIIASMEEVKLKNTGYTPDVVLKTDKGTYIVIEVCYKNPKNDNYEDKFKRIKNLEKVYEMEVDFNEILNTKVLFDMEKVKRIEKKRKELFNEAEIIRKYILDNYYENGGLVFDYYDHMPYVKFVLHKDLEPKYGYAYNKFAKTQYKYIISSSLKCKKFKVCLVRHLQFEEESLSAKSNPFYINIYDYKNLQGYLGNLGELVNTYGLNKIGGFINVFLVE